MDISFFQIVLLFLVSCVIGMGSILDEWQMHRPLVACTLIGLILGDIKTGIIVGGALEIVAIGWMNIGAAVAPDTALASVTAPILAIVTKQDPIAAISLAIPIAAAGQMLTVLVRTLTIGFQHAADRAADRGDLQAITRLHLGALSLQALRIAIPSVIFAYTAGTDTVQEMLRSIPEVIITGLKIAGGMIVAVGYAMIINMMRVGYLMPFFYLGFVVAAFTDFNLVALGVLGLVGAIFYIQLNPKYSTQQIAIANNGAVNDLDDELD